VRPLIRPLGRSFGAARALTAGAVALLIALLIGVALPAGAAPICIFDPNTATVTVEVGNGESAVIGRSGDAITLDGSPCDVATVTNTDAIVVNGTGIPAEISLDLVGGAFAPGLTVESDGSSEIEFTINLQAGSPTVRVAGGGGTDDVVVGAGGINLNADEPAGDADVLVNGLPAIALDGGGGSDVLSVAGGAGTGAPATASVNGGAEGDLLLGGVGGSLFDGGAGTDTIDYAAATSIQADLGGGLVIHESGQTDQVTGVENLTGSPGADRITGDGGSNGLRGGAGGDMLAGAGGDDTLGGQAGIDTADFTGSPNPVTVVLASGSATGNGLDSLSEIENVIGSPANDRLTGDQNANEISGGDGDDRIDGRGGDDTLDGGAGTDTLAFGQLQAGVTVDLRDETSKGDGADTVRSFEIVRGTDHADTIHGDDRANTLFGALGQDEVFGHAGRDDVKGNGGNDLLDGQRGDDSVFGGSGKDQLSGGDGEDFCKGGPDPDSFVFCEHITLG
jgi:Ca2+-binding RTX toxin-like protein